MYFLAVDPGQSGAWAILIRRRIKTGGTTLSLYSVLRSKNATGAEIKDWLRPIIGGMLDTSFTMRAVIESVHAMPKQGVSSSFNFGKSFGHALGLLDAFEIPYQLVTPQRWQKDLGCRTGGDKNITKQLCHRLFPKYQATHADADAILLAYWLAKFGK